MFQKIAKIAIVPFVFLLVFFPGALMAQNEEGVKPIFGGDTSTPETEGVKGIEKALSGSSVVATGSVRDLIIKYVNFSLPLLALAAFAGFVYAGFLYATAYGAEEPIGKAKKVMTYAVIGLALVILSYSIVQLFTVGLAEGVK